MAQVDNSIDVEIVEAWQQFVQTLLGVLVLTGAGLMVYYAL
jgi:hypothetical protein